MGRLATKIAIVTGAANGIGRAIALRFAAEGAAVVIGDIDGAGLTRTATAISSTGGTTSAVTGDLTEEEGAAALIDTAVDRYGRIDILVNNLGGSRNAKVWEMSVADFDFVLRLNLRSTFLCTRAAVTHMELGRFQQLIVPARRRDAVYPHITPGPPQARLNAADRRRMTCWSA